MTTLLPAHPSGLLSTRESARLVGVGAGTIRKWRSLGYLASQGLDERGYPLHSAEAVRAAEKCVQQRGLAASGVDPRALRGLPRAVTPAPAVADAVVLFLDAHLPMAPAAYAMAG